MTPPQGVSKKAYAPQLGVVGWKKAGWLATPPDFGITWKKIPHLEGSRTPFYLVCHVPQIAHLVFTGRPVADMGDMAGNWQMAGWEIKCQENGRLGNKKYSTYKGIAWAYACQLDCDGGFSFHDLSCTEHDHAGRTGGSCGRAHFRRPDGGPAG